MARPWRGLDEALTRPWRRHFGAPIATKYTLYVYDVDINRSNTPAGRGGFNGYAVIPPTPLSFSAPLGAFGSHPGVLRDCLGIFWCLRGGPARALKSSWRRVGSVLDVLGASWGSLRASRELLGASYECFKSVLVKNSWAVLGRSWERFGVFLGRFCSSKSIWKAFWKRFT